MRRVKKGLMDLLNVEINPMMNEFRPRNHDWEDWLIFEGAYEEVLRLIRLHIL
jgi:hypothetical protein